MLVSFFKFEQNENEKNFKSHEPIFYSQQNIDNITNV